MAAEDKQTVGLIGPLDAPGELERGVAAALEQAGYALRWAADAEALLAGDLDDLAAVLLDGVPGEGVAICRRLREALTSSAIPVVALVSRAAASHAGRRKLADMLSMPSGEPCSDDFVLWPCEPGELAARITLARRSLAPAISGDAVAVGELVIDPTNYEASLRGTRLDLTFKEYELLKHLASSRGQVFTREMLLKDIWGYDYYGGTRTVDVHVRRVRMKLGLKYGALVETVRNVGYRFSKQDPLA